VCASTDGSGDGLDVDVAEIFLGEVMGENGFAEVFNFGASEDGGLLGFVVDVFNADIIVETDEDFVGFDDGGEGMSRADNTQVVVIRVASFDDLDDFILGGGVMDGGGVAGHGF